MNEGQNRLVVGISGASGAILGIRLLETSAQLGIETHLVVSPSARLTIHQETDYELGQVLERSSHHYAHGDISAPIASGSYPTRGMVIIPCSIKTLSGVANAYANNLLVRAADVTLKEGRPLILVVREAPLHLGHLRLMEKAAESGATIFPPVPAFYGRPQKAQEIVDQIVGRVLARLGIPNDLYTRWTS